MTASPPDDRLVALWQTAPKPDTQHLLQDLQTLNRTHRQTYRAVFAIAVGIAALLAFEEGTGRLMTHGALSAIWTLGIALGALWHWRARSDASDALALDTVRLLKFMVARAKRGLFIARCLYAGAPLGAFAAWATARVIGIGAPPAGPAVDPQLHLIQTGAGVAALIAMAVTGLVLARSRRAQVQDFSEKLKSVEADL